MKKTRDTEVITRYNLVAMSDYTTNEIAAKLLAGLRTRCAKKLEESRIHYRNGDTEWYAGEREESAREYRAALMKMNEVNTLRGNIDELTAEWMPPTEQEIATTQWKATDARNHRGVGEGDAGLPEEELAELDAQYDARRCALRPRDTSEEIPAEILHAYREARKNQPSGALVIRIQPASFGRINHPSKTLADAVLPWCDRCTETACAVAIDGTCAQIRRYLASDRPQHPAECNALNPHNPGFIGPDDVADS